MTMRSVAVWVLVIIGAAIGYLAGAIFAINVYPSGILIIACTIAGGYAGRMLGRAIFNHQENVEEV